MNTKKNFTFKSCMIFILAVCVSVTSVMSEAFAADKKTRLNVGWTLDSGVETLYPDNSWEVSTMGCMWWQCVYSQVWYTGQGPDYRPVPGLADSWERR